MALCWRLGKVAGTVTVPGVAHRAPETLDKQDAVVRHQRNLGTADPHLACRCLGHRWKGRQDWRLDRPGV